MNDGFDPSDIPAPVLDAGWEQDSTSVREEEHWNKYDDISKAKKNNTLKVHRTVGWLIPIALVISFAAFLTLSGVYVWHLVAAPSYRWLKPEELQNIHSMIFSSVVGGAIAILTKTYFSSPEK